jgi:hypothetical protein
MPPDTDSNNLFLKLIFWTLAALFAVMTAIGGFAATHLISEVDSIHAEMDMMHTQVSTDSATGEIYRKAMEIRLDRIERKLDK